ncbi:MAG: nucleotidyl transferase AbiEii/AbiGii toxin family protein [bacterium]
MLINDLKTIVSKNPTTPPAYLRALLKERLQYYVLQFVSTSAYSKSLLFKGGTCLRFFYDLPRLSEDLDFDVIGLEFNMSDFDQSITKHFKETLQFKDFTTKLAGNNRTLYLKFPILYQILPEFNNSDSPILFLRFDVANVIGTKYQTDISTKSTGNFAFIIRHYALPDLFAGKIAAILQREIIDGLEKVTRTKGRDYYDLIWYLEKKTTPNWNYLEELTAQSKAQILQSLQVKIDNLDLVIIEQDLLPFFPDPNFVKSFCQNLRGLYSSYSKILLSSNTVPLV